MQDYDTILEAAEDEFVEKRSRFICAIAPVTTPDVPDTPGGNPDKLDIVFTLTEAELAEIDSMIDDCKALSYDPNAKCDHHDHHGQEHSCGDHGCGSHNCDGHSCH